VTVSQAVICDRARARLGPKRSHKYTHIYGTKAKIIFNSELN